MNIFNHIYLVSLSIYVTFFYQYHEYKVVSILHFPLPSIDDERLIDLLVASGLFLYFILELISYLRPVTYAYSISVEDRSHKLD